MSLVEAFYHHQVHLAAEAYSDGARCHMSDPLDPDIADCLDDMEVFEGRADAMYPTLSAEEPTVYITDADYPEVSAAPLMHIQV